MVINDYQKSRKFNEVKFIKVAIFTTYVPGEVLESVEHVETVEVNGGRGHRQMVEIHRFTHLENEPMNIRIYIQTKCGTYLLQCSAVQVFLPPAIEKNKTRETTVNN